MRDIVRRDRPKLASVEPTGSGKKLSVRQIQQLVRAGATAAQIVAEYNVELTRVQQFETPMLAERANAARQARRLGVGPQSDSPTLGDVVVDRLAARGVDPATISWDAVRASTSVPWEIIVRFAQDGRECQAHWSMERSNKTLTALDEEAVWLTETAAPAGSLPAVTKLPRLFGPDQDQAQGAGDSQQQGSSDGRDGRGDSGDSGTDADSDATAAGAGYGADQGGDAAATQKLLDEVNAQRGVRQEIDWDEILGGEDEGGAGTGRHAHDGSRGNQREADTDQVVQLSRPAPPPPQPDALLNVDEVADPTPLQGQPGQVDAQQAGDRAAGRASRRKRNRQPVPPWEDIVFGPK